MKKQITACLLALVMLLSLFPVQAGATVSRSDRFRKVSLTGDPAEDICRIAEAQKDLTDAAFGYGEAWCADFVSDCAKIAGQGAAVPANGWCPALRRNILNAGGRVTTGNPQKGDIAFFRHKGGSELDHVEIYLGVRNGRHTYVGGNDGPSPSRVMVVARPFNGTVLELAEIIRPNYRRAEPPAPPTPPPHSHHYSAYRTVSPTCTEGGYTIYRCSCGDEQIRDRTDPLGHDYDSGTVSVEPTCQGRGEIIYQCRRCGERRTETLPQADHRWQSVRSEPGDEVDPPYTIYECAWCGRTRTSRDEMVSTDWSTRRPGGVPEEDIESKRQYRSAEYERKESTSDSLPGYTLDDTYWKKTGSSCLEYAQFPDGFDRSHPLYRKYANTPRTGAQSGNRKTEVSQRVIGYIYWHWCYGSYQNGPIDRCVDQYYSSTYPHFDAFFSTTPPSEKEQNGRVWKYPNADCCRDTYWYYSFPVYEQTAAEYQKTYVHTRLGPWSDWQDEPILPLGRKVEERTLYRHTYPKLVLLEDARSKTVDPGSVAVFHVQANKDAQYRWYEHDPYWDSWNCCDEYGAETDTMRVIANKDTHGKRYFCAVRSKEGEEVESREVQLTMRWAEEAPTLRAHLRSDGKPVLEWTSEAGTDRFVLYCSDNGGGSFTSLGTFAGPRVVHGSAQAGRTYQYRITPVYPDHSGGYDSNTVTITAGEVQLERPVTRLRGKSSTGKPYLTWEEVAGAEKYEVYRKIGKDGSYRRLFTTTGTRMTNGSAQPGQTCYYQVRAIAGDGGRSLFSAEKHRTCDCARPVTEITLRSGDPRLTWQAVPGAAKYEVSASSSADGPFRHLLTTSGTHLNHRSADPGETWFYRVRALCVNPYGSSAWSRTVSIRAR